MEPTVDSQKESSSQEDVSSLEDSSCNLQREFATYFFQKTQLDPKKLTNVVQLRKYMGKNPKDNWIELWQFYNMCQELDISRSCQK